MPLITGSTRRFVFFPTTHPVHQLPNELKSHIISFCDMPTLVALLYDGQWRRFVETELMLTFLKTLSKVTAQPVAFRDMMRLTKAIITGSTALHYILRQPVEWQPSDLDLIVPLQSFEIALSFIVKLPGAIVRFDSDDEANNAYPGLRRGYTRMVQVQTTYGCIDVMQSSSRSPFNPLPSYWGTHVMNALTADSFICPYPKLTYRHIALVKHRSQHPTITAVEHKYRSRGFTLYTSTRQFANLSESCHDFSACSGRDRYFGDYETLIVPIWDVDYRANDWAEPEAEFTTAWRLGGKACGNMCCFLPSRPASSTVRLLPGDCPETQRLSTSYYSMSAFHSINTRFPPEPTTSLSPSTHPVIPDRSVYSTLSPPFLHSICHYSSSS
ncbi:hypothetical protein QCA50_015092 [Cerrena zonata]|uniref:F-box domain-containing protein n=1 Tax=Cerrena zonata TaxID=2478898 RepID=A0AAW0FYA1_9APHY